MKKEVVGMLTCAVLLIGCKKNWTEKMHEELEKGLCARFENGELDGIRTYGYDVSYLQGRIRSHFREQLPDLSAMSLNDCRRMSSPVYFLALKYEDDSHHGIRRDKTECLRIQYASVEHLGSTGSDRIVGREWPDYNRSFTFFIVTESNEVYALCVDVSRNPHHSNWIQGRDFSYGSVCSPINIWDTSLPDRNRPEQIFKLAYREMFAITTERPFNYLAYQTVAKLNNLRRVKGTSVFRLCWGNDKCLIFIPEYLCGIRD